MLVMKLILCQVCVVTFILMIRLTLISSMTCTEYVTYTVAATMQNFHLYTQSCGFWGLYRCTRIKYSTGYYIKYMKKLQCCSGYGGKQCLHIDECTDGTHDCQEICVNNNGSYTCSCGSDTTLRSNGRSCLGSVNDLTASAETHNFTLFWSPPINHSFDSNIVLAGYNVKCNATDKNEFIPFPTINHSLASLSPFTVYQCCVKPEWTTNGMNEAGPTKCIEVLTLENETFPETVISYLTINIITNRSVNISWYPSAFIEEGVNIDEYHVLIRNLTEDNHNTAMYTWALNSSNSNHEIEGLEPYVPYEVSIVASNTSTGTNGAATQVHNEVFFTSQSAPSIAPVWSLIDRESISTIRLAWTPLTLEESRGFITNYTLRYADVNHSNICGTKAIQNITDFETTNSTMTLVTLTDLSLRSQYCVSICASTVVGYGEYSQWELVKVADNQLFIFFINKIPSSCEEWIQQNVPIKLTDFTNELAAIMNDSCADCISLIPSDYIYKTPSFLPYCTNNGLAIIETTLFTYETLLQTIHDWVEESPNMTMNETVVIVESFCTSSSNCSYLPQYQSVTAWPFLSTPSLKADQPLPNSTLSLSLSPLETMQVEVDTVGTSQYITPLIITVSIVTILVAVGVMVGCAVILVNKRKKSRSRYELKENHSSSTISGRQNSSVDLPNPCYDGLALSALNHQHDSTTPNGDHNDPAEGHEYEETSYEAGNTEANYSLIDHDDEQNETFNDVNNIYYEGTTLPLNNTTTSTTNANGIDNNDTHQAEYSCINNDQQNANDIKVKPNCYTNVPPSPAINAVYQQVGLERGNDLHFVGNESEYSHLNHTGWNQVDTVMQNIAPQDYLDPCTVVHIRPSADRTAGEALKEADKSATQQHAYESADESCVYSLANEVYTT